MLEDLEVSGIPTISRTHPRHVPPGENPGPEKGCAETERQPEIRIREADWYSSNSLYETLGLNRVKARSQLKILKRIAYNYGVNVAFGGLQLGACTPE
jgi:hypothetical protein